MGGFNPRKVEQMEQTIQDLSEFAKHLTTSGKPKYSKQVRQAIKVIRNELKKMKGKGL